MEQMYISKLQAIKMGKKNQFLSSLTIHFLTALTCTLVCSYPFWYPSLCSSIKHFLFTFLPHVWFSFLNPKSLFIVANIIVAVLVGESKLSSYQSTPANDIYEEYVERNKCVRKVSKLQVQENIEEKGSKTEESFKACDNDEAQRLQIKAHGEEKAMIKEKIDDNDYDEDVIKENIEDDDHDDEDDVKRDYEEEFGLPTKELNKRAEEFIAKVNRQRWLEARSLVCIKA